MKDLTYIQPQHNKGQLTPWEQIEILRDAIEAEESTSFRRLNTDDDNFENYWNDEN